MERDGLHKDAETPKTKRRKNSVGHTLFKASTSTIGMPSESGAAAADAMMMSQANAQDFHKITAKGTYVSKQLKSPTGSGSEMQETSGPLFAKFQNGSGLVPFYCFLCVLKLILHWHWHSLRVLVFEPQRQSKVGDFTRLVAVQHGCARTSSGLQARGGGGLHGFRCLQTHQGAPSRVSHAASRFVRVPFVVPGSRQHCDGHGTAAAAKVRRATAHTAHTAHATTATARSSTRGTVTVRARSSTNACTALYRDPVFKQPHCQCHVPQRWQCRADPASPPLYDLAADDGCAVLALCSAVPERAAARGRAARQGRLPPRDVLLPTRVPVWLHPRGQLCDCAADGRVDGHARHARVWAARPVPRRAVARLCCRVSRRRARLYVARVLRGRRERDGRRRRARRAARHL